MRALVYDAIGSPWHIAEVAEPTPAPDGVVVRVEAVGLCRSDWHAWHGHDNVSRFPHVPGHEFAGTVVDVGAGVTRWRVGDRVAVPFVCACGSCLVCEAGQHQVCPHQWQPGFDGWGGFAEYVALPQADVNLVRLPPEIPARSAAALGCRIATAYRALAIVAAVHAGDDVVVHGCGGVGLACVMVARALGARVIAVDPQADARERAMALGAGLALAPADATAEDVRGATGLGPTVTVDALGDAGVCRAAIESLRPRGRHVQIGLLPPPQQVEAVPMPVVISRELQVLGSHGMAAHDYPEMLELVRSGRLRPDLLVARTITFDEVPAAIALIDTADQPAGITVAVP